MLVKAPLSVNGLSKASVRVYRDLARCRLVQLGLRHKEHRQAARWPLRLSAIGRLRLRLAIPRICLQVMRRLQALLAKRLAPRSPFQMNTSPNPRWCPSGILRLSRQRKPAPPAQRFAPENSVRIPMTVRLRLFPIGLSRLSRNHQRQHRIPWARNSVKANKGLFLSPKPRALARTAHRTRLLRLRVRKRRRVNRTLSVIGR